MGCQALAGFFRVGVRPYYATKTARAKMKPFLDHQKIINKRKSGVRISDIAAQEGCSIRRVHAVLNEYGLTKHRKARVKWEKVVIDGHQWWLCQKWTTGFRL